MKWHYHLVILQLRRKMPQWDPVSGLLDLWCEVMSIASRIKRDCAICALFVALASAAQFASFGVVHAGTKEAAAEPRAEKLRKYANKGVSSAQFLLGRLYERGKQVPKDLESAANWYQKAADQGHAAAKFWLSRLYRYGEGVEKDKNKADQLRREAAEQGNAEAQHFLGIHYQYMLQATDGEADYASAVKWYRRAAEQGYAEAQVALGVLFAEGKGVPQDYVRAHMWFNLAAAQGHELGNKNRNEVAGVMTEEQIAEAQRMAREFSSEGGK